MKKDFVFGGIFQATHTMKGRYFALRVLRIGPGGVQLVETYNFYGCIVIIKTDGHSHHGVGSWPICFDLQSTYTFLNLTF